MPDPFIGQIQAFGFNFAPRVWAKCDGQLLSISQYSALFSLLGTYYGGDGRTTFALPDLRGRVLEHDGAGPGLSHKTIGQRGGREEVVIDVSHMPNHAHSIACQSAGGNATSPSGAFPAASAREQIYSDTQNATMDHSAVSSVGGSRPLHVEQPYLVVNYCIALQGIYPSRN